MVAFRHPCFVSPSVLVFILFLEVWRPSLCQVGLRTLPLTASRNRSTNLGLYSKWSEGASSNPSANAPAIEMELAAILRDIAYGVPTESTTTTTTTTTSTTTQKPTTKEVSFQESYDSVGIQPPSSVTVSPPWENQPKGKNGAKPVQHQYVESPVIEPSDNYGYEKNDEDFPIPEDSGPVVVKSDVGVSEVPWLTSIGVMWEVHVYTTAGLFSLIVLLSLYCLTRVHLSTQLLPRGHYITVHLLVFLAAFFRCVYFFHDPYAAAKLLPIGLSNILFNTGTPCIITALAVLILALLRTARLIILPLNLQSPVVVAVISGALVAGSIIIDVFGGLLKEQQIAPGLKGVMQALTAGWGAALCIGYIIVFIRIERAARRQQNEIVRLTFSRLHIEGSSLPRRFPKSSLKFGARFTLIASISGLLLAALRVYGLINSEMVTDLPPLQPWVWLVYQTSSRILEITMWACICVASSLPANLTKNERSKGGMDDGQLLTVFACKRCTSCSNLSSCCVFEKNSSDDMYSTICQTNHVARNFSIHSEGKLIPQDTIASTGLPPKHISTTLLPPKARKSITKASALHSTASDAQLLWNNNSNANSSNSSSRPSSLILTEGGLIKFRTHDTHSETVRIISYPKKEYDSKIELHETHKKILESSAEDNYINSGALTPEEKRIIEKTFQSGKLQQLRENEGNNEYADVVQQNISCNRGKIGREEYSPLHDPSKYTNTCSSINVANSFDVHFYEDGENGFYQTPSLDSSIEGSGHIYASIQQPLNQVHHVQQIRRHEGGDYSQGKILNNSNSIFQASAHQRRSSSSNQSHLDVIPTDYLTDASQDHIESPNSDHRSLYLGSPNYFHQTDQFYLPRSGMSPIHGYRCYVPKSQLREHRDSPQTPLGNSDYIQQGFSYDQPRNNIESDEIAPGCPISPSQRKRFLSKIGTSNFENVSYTPLQGEDDQYPQTCEEKIRPCGHRPRKAKLSPLSSDSSKQFMSNPNPDHRQITTTTTTTTITTPTHTQNLRREDNGMGEKDIEKNNFYLSQKEKEKLKQKFRESSSDETNPQNDFAPLKAHKFLSEGVPWTDLETSQKAPSGSSAQQPSMERSNADIHRKCIETNDDSTEKSIEVRWGPIRCKEETGV